jgi:hypothetical protein
MEFMKEALKASLISPSCRRVRLSGFCSFNFFKIEEREPPKLREREQQIKRELKELPGSHRLQVDHQPEWESKLVRRLHEQITALAETAQPPERDVLRFTVPLTATWNKFNPLRNNTTFQHWGVVVADFGKEVVDTVMRNRKELKKKKRGWCLGVVHELSRVGCQSAYRMYKWMSNAIKAGCKFLSVGKTKLKDDGIVTRGIQT